MRVKEIDMGIFCQWSRNMRVFTQKKKRLGIIQCHDLRTVVNESGRPDCVTEVVQHRETLDAKRAERSDPIYRMGARLEAVAREYLKQKHAILSQKRFSSQQRD